MNCVWKYCVCVHMYIHVYGYTYTCIHVYPYIYTQYIQWWNATCNHNWFIFKHDAFLKPLLALRMLEEKTNPPQKNIVIFLYFSCLLVSFLVWGILQSEEEMQRKQVKKGLTKFQSKTIIRSLCSLYWLRSKMFGLHLCKNELESPLL